MRPAGESAGANHENPAVSRASRHRSNPFADEDAQTDLVFKGYCIRNTYHPAWDKIYGDPSEPATSVVFGEKGSGKTALRLQIARRLTDYNADHPEQQVFVVQYDDFNPFLDRFRDRFSGRRRRVERMLAQWRLWDHIDAILSLAVTQLVDRVLELKQARHPAARDEPLPIESLDRSQARDVLLLAACYDQSTAENPQQRWRQAAPQAPLSDLAVEMGPRPGDCRDRGGRGACVFWFDWHWFGQHLAVAGRLPPAGCRGRGGWLQLAVAGLADRPQYPRARPQRRPAAADAHELSRRPAWSASRCPPRQRTDDRYELLGKLQGLLRTLRFDGHRGAGRSRGRALPDQRLDRTDAGPGLADAGQQVPQASGHGGEAAAAHRVGAAVDRRGPRFPPAGPAGQAEPDPLAGVDRPVALRPGQRAAEGVCGRRGNRPRWPSCSTARSTTAG